MTGSQLLGPQLDAFLPRLGRFIRKPWQEKLAYVEFRFLRLLLSIPVPVRLPFGAWWLARNDAMGLAVFRGRFETTELQFVNTFLRPDMNVLDIGAHHGLYTLLASRRVGPSGRVTAFEPSPREYRKLLRHLRLNRCVNVRPLNCALGNEEREAELFVVEGCETGCNSLRPPNVAEPTRKIPVWVCTLDSCLDREKIEKVDFVKLDVEGAELEVLKGAGQLLARQPRPVFLCEVQEIRCSAWGYAAKEIILLLRGLGYHWFVPSAGGRLKPLSSDQPSFDGNFVAVPDERLSDGGLFTQLSG
jgi:FkbM family methyltransferase